MLDLSAHRQLVAQSSGLRYQGKVVQVVGLSIEVEGLRLPLGEICHLYPDRATAGASRVTAEGVGLFVARLILMPLADTHGARQMPADVVRFRDDRVILLPLAHTHGVRPGTAVFPGGRGFVVPVGEELL